MTELAADVLTAALHQDERGRSAWGRASSHPDFLDHAPYQLLPLLYRNLDALGVDDPALPRLKGVYRNSWYRNQQVFAAGQEALERLRSSSVEALVLGGMALATRYYRDRGARPVAAAELLVKPEDVQAAAAALRSGWQAGEREPEGVRLTASSARFARADQPDLILHWRPFFLPVPSEEVWRRPSRVALPGGDEWPALEPAIELMRVCATASEPDRSWVADGLAVARSGEVAWDRLAELAIAWRLPEQGARLAELRAEDPLGVPAAAVERALQAPPGPGDRIAQMSRRAGVHAGRLGSHWQRYRRLRTMEPGACGVVSYWTAVAAARGRRLPFRL